jgi:uncharacterized protein
VSPYVQGGYAIGPQVLAASKARAEASPDRFQFEEVEAGVDIDHHVADGYKARPLIRWGDKLFPDSLPFDLLQQTAAAQLRQFGYNNDYIAYFPIDGSSHGLLCVNHEYTNEELMFPALKERQDTTGFKDMTEELVDIEMAAHGVTVFEVVRNGENWGVVLDSPYNRRISAPPPWRLTVRRQATNGCKPAATLPAKALSACSTTAPAVSHPGTPISPRKRISTSTSGPTSATPTTSLLRASAANRQRATRAMGCRRSGRPGASSTTAAMSNKELNEPNRFG